jgi:hypothetical protein
MAITINKVGIEIDGKVYQFYKVSFGFQRKLVELQTNMQKIRSEIANKYHIDPDTIETSDKLGDNDKLLIAQSSLGLQEAVATLFVNKDEASILDNFDGENIAQLIQALK